MASKVNDFLRFCRMNVSCIQLEHISNTSWTCPESALNTFWHLPNVRNMSWICPYHFPNAWRPKNLQTNLQKATETPNPKAINYKKRSDFQSRGKLDNLLADKNQSFVGRHMLRRYGFRYCYESCISDILLALFCSFPLGVCVNYDCYCIISLKHVQILASHTTLIFKGWHL